MLEFTQNEYVELLNYYVYISVSRFHLPSVLLTLAVSSFGFDRNEETVKHLYGNPLLVTCMTVGLKLQRKKIYMYIY